MTSLHCKHDMELAKEIMYQGLKGCLQVLALRDIQVRKDLSYIFLIPDLCERVRPTC